jgi:hypothetical protein
MRVTWITDDAAPAIVEYGTTSGQYPLAATGNTTTYSYVLYKSGNIHDAVIGPLQPSTTYYYRCSSNPSREFSFRTPPATLPFKFVIVGKLHGFSCSGPAAPMACFDGHRRRCVQVTLARRNGRSPR